MHESPHAIGGKEKPTLTRARFGCLHVLAFAAAAMLLAAGLAFWWYRHNIDASPFAPTRLSQREREVLQAKLAQLEEASGGAEDAGDSRQPTRVGDPRAGGPLKPEPYSEGRASREINLTEREVNALVARDEEMAKRVAIDMADDLVSVRLLVPMSDDFPILGGKTLRLNVGVALGYDKGRPLVAVRGVSLGGVPLPNAWLGDIKNKNLVEQFGGEGGFWDLFARGVDDIEVREGHLRLTLKE